MSIDDSSPRLEVGFVIDTGDSFGGLMQLQAAMDSTEAKVLADATRIERATRGMVDVSAATSNVVAFGNATSREMQTARQAIATAEKAGERLVAQLERQNSVFGKTREEVRSAKAEFAALAAEQQGLTELAGRIRSEELALVTATNQAAAAATAEAAALRQAAYAHQMFEARVKAGVVALREEEAASLAAAAALDAQARREAALASAMFEARAKQGMRDYGVQQTADESAKREANAAAMRLEELAAEQLAREHAALASTVRASHDAQVADAAAAEQLRMATDPLYVSTKKLNDQIAESTRLYHAGATAPAEYARQQEVLTGRLRQSAQAQDDMDRVAKKGKGTLTQLSFQLNDVATMAAMGAAPFQIFASQAGQIFQVAQMAEGGVKGFAAEMGGLAVAFLPAIAVASVAGVALYRWKEQINEDAGMKKFAEGLGLTSKEMKKLGDQSITTGDMVAGVWKTITDGLNLGGSGKSLMDYLFSPNDAQQVQGFLASIYATFTGTYAAIVELWSSISTSVSAYVSAAATAVAQFFAPVVAAAQWAGNGIAQIFNAIYNRVAGWLKSIGSAISDFAGPILKAMGQSDAATAVTSAGSSLGKAFGKGYARGAGQVVNGTNAFFATAAENIISKSQERLLKKANEIKANRTPKKTPVDSHAASLVRDSEAIEAQIRNLYKLADAYGVSGAAALIAEARVKAESKAIKQRADIEASVDRQVRLAIAQRVSDVAKSTATARDQAAAQMLVNAQVAAGLVPAMRAAELVKDQIADLPLLAAIEAARTRGLTTEAERATKALADQRAARADLTTAERSAQFNTDMASGNDRLAQMREELRLVGATDMERVRALATLKATQEAQKYNPGDRAAYIEQQVAIAVGAQQVVEAQAALNAELRATADLFDTIDQTAQRAAQGMADAFGKAGSAIGDALTVMTGYYADQAKLQEAHTAAIDAAGDDQKKIDRENRLSSLRSSSQQISAFGDMTAAAKRFFKEGSTGYQALATAEKAFRLVQLAMSVRAIAQDAIETGSKIANSVARIAVGATEAVVNAIKSLPFPLNIAAGAATVAALAGIGVSVAGSFGSSKSDLAPTNTGTGTVLGDSSAKSESIRNAIDALKDVDTVMLSYSRDMAASLKSIDSQIGGVAALVVRAGNIDASAGVNTGFKSNATATMAGIGMAIGGPIGAGIGAVLTKIPVIGSLLSGLFGTKTSVIGNGLSGGPQSVGSILNSGFDASYYSDVKKKSSFLGISTGTKYSTQYGAADAGLENQFTLILRQFNDAIVASAGPLGAATGDIQNRLNRFVVNIGKIDLKDLTGEQIQEKLTAIFGAAADGMAAAAFPAVAQFQKVGEGTFETLVRVASTVEAVGASLDLLGTSAQAMGIAAKLGLADQFDSVSALTSAADAYFGSFYTKEEQATAKTAQFAGVFSSLGMAMPETLAGFRQLVEAQDLTSAAGQATYATLLQLAPAFADLQASMEGAKSAADIASERQDLQRQLLELRGDTSALRALDLAKLDASNRGLQQEIYAVQDAQAAASAAKTLADAWTSVGDSIMDKVNRIRGVTDAAGGNGFAALQGQFNAANTAARGGDQDAAKTLPALSQALLTAAAEQATSRQELERVRAMTAASLEATYGVISALGNGTTTPTTEQMTSRQELDRVQAMNDASRQAAYGVVSALAAGTAASGRAATPIDTMITAANVATGKAPAPANDDMIVSAIEALQEEVAGLRRENSSAQSEIARHAKGIDRKLDDVTADHNGMAFSVSGASAA
ncbi:hypothetical protein [Sphingomonas sp. Leaf30]|uniref:hypothetical protein n=1 Tax=Sphingomonas sp. Leaf30 TaxID=1736213 RepID=UPI0006FC27A9|nr:hypothetical protein [Sphingomonas sp. Leaf30]KQN11556.1 hypothetical protein ASE89_14300 [Sphingomonas sp. Leaf30]